MNEIECRRRIDALPISRAAREEAKNALAASAAAVEMVAAVEMLARAACSWLKRGRRRGVPGVRTS